MKLTWHRRRVHLRHPFSIARRRDERSTERTALLVAIEHEGRVGLGEAAPSAYYHQTLDSSEAALAGAASMLAGPREPLGLDRGEEHDPLAFDAILDPIAARFPGESAALAAIDGALHDLAGKLLGVPVWKLLGLDARRAPLTSFTIGIDELDVIARKVAEAAEFPILKVKVGTDQDDAVLATIRRAAPDKTLRVDANCAFGSHDVLERCRALARYGVELIEQPTPAGAHDALPSVRSAGLAPIFADESCVGATGVLACAGAFDGINIKLSKCGGIRRAVAMIHAARAAGLRVMLGCMVETSVGIAAAAHLAPLADYVDLDGHLVLADDPFGGIGGAGGRLTLGDRPGLGVAPSGAAEPGATLHG